MTESEEEKVRRVLERAKEEYGFVPLVSEVMSDRPDLFLPYSEISSGLFFKPRHMDRRTAELAAIAGYLHDLGNGISRLDHGIVAALLCRHILQRLGMPAEEYAEVMCAIGNHEEEYGEAISPLAAAVILGDKSDVHSSRVRVPDRDTEDIHDLVNLATTHSFLAVDADAGTITLKLEIDTEIIQVMQYFEIFLARMVMCRRAAEFLGCRFGIVSNGQRLL
ncbi:MAG TPA: HD domain-containing protein [Methanomassiliicoccales archaeon]|nr:HD domain-containing protein [Methanomassiliicoccales archaeon]